VILVILFIYFYFIFNTFLYYQTYGWTKFWNVNDQFEKHGLKTMPCGKSDTDENSIIHYSAACCVCNGILIKIENKIKNFKVGFFV